MHILGLSNGSVHGNSEILLKAALSAALAKDSQITVSWIHMPSVVIPRNPKPLRADASIIPNGDTDPHKIGVNPTKIDDRAAVLNAIMDADAFIVATPVYSHQPPGTLKELADYILGPYADTSKAFQKKQQAEANIQEKNQSTGTNGTAAYTNGVTDGANGTSNGASNSEITPDPRETKPRVAGFIAVAGSVEQFTEQWTMALPSMHVLTYSIHAKVVDQVVLPGNANTGAVLLQPERTLARACLLGERVASQLGRPFDEAQYLGPEEPGACPYCHLLKLEFCTGNNVQCIVCGTRGALAAGANGDIRPTWETDSDVSCLTLKGKWNHIDDIREQLQKERLQLPRVAAEWEYWKALQFPVVEMPSRSVNGLAVDLEKTHIQD
ncbi:hypothetical protein Sste5346_006190 [Sporothrix stenoceras]|uniref:NADPH-dependent FMN reductase-like domain-containing protein n=1 Tax=Sporothrix stenoceras TaxID=5173 RepID=A0ABR3Z0M1_9PEZI